MYEAIILFLAAAIQAGIPLLFATLGESITEKVGNLNLGVEGMMLIGAVMGFSVALKTGNPALAIIAALVAGALGSLIYAFLTVTLRANQVVSGLALTIFGSGFSSFMGQKLIGQTLSESFKASVSAVKIPILGDIPFIGPIFFHQDFLVYIGYLVAIALGIYINNTVKGLNVKVVGENPAAADAAGINVGLYKYVHILLGGALCGLGGAYLSLVSIPSWQDGVTAGRGWIAVALVIFVTWSPYRAIFGAFFFGALDIVGFRIQKFELPISQSFIDMLPYVVTIIVLIVTSMKKSKESAPPQSLGVAYFREDR